VTRNELPGVEYLAGSFGVFCANVLESLWPERV